MTIMDMMMNAMVGTMRPGEKQETMLKLMPEMMKHSEESGRYNPSITKHYEMARIVPHCLRTMPRPTSRGRSEPPSWPP